MKKVLIIGAIGIAALMFFGQKSDETNQPVETNGFRELTDSEAMKYLNDHPDLKGEFGVDLEKAKWHWRVMGYPNEQDTRINPYLS